MEMSQVNKDTYEVFEKDLGFLEKKKDTLKKK